MNTQAPSWAQDTKNATRCLATSKATTIQTITVHSIMNIHGIKTNSKYMLLSQIPGKIPFIFEELVIYIYTSAIL